MSRKQQLYKGGCGVLCGIVGLFVPTGVAFVLLLSWTLILQMFEFGFFFH